MNKCLKIKNNIPKVNKLIFATTQLDFDNSAYSWKFFIDFGTELWILSKSLFFHSHGKKRKKGVYLPNASSYNGGCYDLMCSSKQYDGEDMMTQ